MKTTTSKEQMAVRLLNRRKKAIEQDYGINEKNYNDSFAHRDVATMKAAVRYRELKEILDKIEEYQTMNEIISHEFGYDNRKLDELLDPQKLL